MMKSPFKNDPFCILDKAFKKLYDKEYEAQIAPILHDEEGKEIFGQTILDEVMPVIEISANIPYQDMIEIFAHELAHVAVGETAEPHGIEWEHAFENIFQEYERIGKRFYEDENRSK